LLARIDMIVLNGGSSSGKTSIARSLQAVLTDPWLAISIDMFVDALPPALQAGGPGIGFGTGGEVSVGPAFRALELTWMQGVAAMVRAGARVIVDDVFLGGAESQQRWRDVLDGSVVLWVGVRCDAEVAARREADRRDRPGGMAALQAEIVHRGVAYDFEVDTTERDADECARLIVARICS
jgi:chloramphenicol 3-O phosphotransferase